MRVFAYALATAACLGLTAPLAHVAASPLNDASAFAGTACEFSAQAKNKKSTKKQSTEKGATQKGASQKETTGRSSWGG